MIASPDSGALLEPLLADIDRHIMEALKRYGVYEVTMGTPRGATSNSPTAGGGNGCEALS